MSGQSGLPKLSSGAFDFLFLLWKENGKDVAPRAVGSHLVTRGQSQLKKEINPEETRL